MESGSDYNSLGALFGLRPPSQDPLAGMFGSDPYPDTTNPYGTGGNLQLAPLYSNPRHQQERVSTLNRYPGGTDNHSHDEYYEDGYEENNESHVSYDASGMHIGVNMSRTRQTPFGPARTNVGMQMSIGHGGMMFSTRSSSSIGGGHGGSLMMARFGGSPNYSGLGQSMFGPVGIFPPLAGLFSPLGGMFSPMTDFYNPCHQHPFCGFRAPHRTSQNQNESNGSDGPIIEELFDEEENRYSGSNDETAFIPPLAVGYKEEEIDPSLGLGLLPDAEAAYRNDSENKQLQEHTRSINNEILNDFAYTESTPTTHHTEPVSEGDNSSRNGIDISQTGTRAISRPENNQEDKNGLDIQAEINRNILSEITDNTVSTKTVPEDLKELGRLHQAGRKADINSVSKDRPKFTKQTFRNTVSQSDDVYDGLPFLRSRTPSDENGRLESQLNADIACDPKMKVNKNKQMTKSKKGVVNKNSSVRRRNDLSCSSSSQQSQTTDIEVSGLSENIHGVPKSQIYSVEQNDANSAIRQNDTIIVSSEFQQKPEDNSTDMNRVAAEEKCLSADTVDRYVSLQETDEHSNSVSGDISNKEYKCRGVWPESLQESEIFNRVIDDSATAQTSSQTAYITKENDTYSENLHVNGSIREVFNIETATPGDKYKPTSVPYKEFEGGPLEKLSLAEQADFHKDTIVDIADAEGQADTEVQNIEQRNTLTGSKQNDIGSSFENRSKDEVILRETSPEDFTTFDSDVNSYTKQVSSEDSVERKKCESSFSAKECDISRTKDDNQTNTDTYDSKADRQNDAIQEVSSSTRNQNQMDERSSSMIVIVFEKSSRPQDVNRPITKFMSKDERKNEAGNMFQVKHVSKNKDSKQSDHEIQAVPEVKTEGRAEQQNKERRLAQRTNEQIPKPEKQKLENLSDISEKLRDRPASYEFTENPVYLKNEGFRTSPVQENFQFAQDGGYKVSEASRNVQQDAFLSPDLGNGREMMERTVPFSVVHHERNKSRQSSQRQQNINTSVDKEIWKGIQGQGPHSQQSYNQDTFVNGGHSNHREGVHHSGGCRGQHMCEQMRRQLQCEHRNVQLRRNPCCNHKYECMDCRKKMTSDEYAKIKTDNDDIFQHPEWNYLNEYRDANGQFAEPRKRSKNAKVNKNAVARTRFAAASSQQEQSGSSGSRPSAISFGDLVGSVGLVMKDVYPDGNCLFTAICDQLRIRGDFSYTPRDLRHAAVDYLREHPCQEDGTPLLAFLADEERNWERYLSSMRREGHWGDHFVIWALAHVLNRRFVIYRGDAELQKTVVEPSGPMTEESFQDIDDNMDNSDVATKGSDTKSADAELDGKPLPNSAEKDEMRNSAEKDEMRNSAEKDEIYLGHVSQSHYVSLRPHDWHDKLFEALKNKQSSCLVGSNPQSNTLDSNGDISVPREVLSFSSCDYLNYFLNYLRRGGFLINVQKMTKIPHRSKDNFATYHFMTATLFRYKLLPNFTKGPRATGLNSYCLSTPLDTTIVEDRRTGNRKDLVLHKENFKVGQFKLIPITPFIWISNLRVINDLSFLKHIKYKERKRRTVTRVIGFKYASWPAEAMEWKTRKRLHSWPSQDTIDEIVETGVLVIPAKHVSTGYRDGADMHEHEGDDLIWEYSFDLSENILCQSELEREAKMFHCILAAVTDLAFEGKSSITEDHIKALTYFTCETFSSEEIQHHPGKCLYYALDQLKEYLQRRHFPHYFMRGRNLIADMKYDEIVWHVERLQVLKANVVAVLYSVLDYCTLENVYDIGKVFDGLSEVAYSRGKKNSDTYLITLSVTALTNMAKQKYFKGMERFIDLWYSELVNTYGQKKIYKEQFVHNILKELSLQEGWLLALYLDCTLGSEYVKYVCKDKATFQLENLFGDEVAVILTEETFLRCEEIVLPASLLGERTVVLAERLGDVIGYDMGCWNAYQSAVHHFLRANTHDILLSVEKDQKDKNDYYTHETLSYLSNLFMNLYETYREVRAEMKFRDLMEVYDELCNFLATENDFIILARLWAYFGENVRAREAEMKAASVRNEAYMMSTTL